MRISIKKNSSFSAGKSLAALVFPLALFLNSWEKENIAAPKPEVVKNAIALDHIRKDTTLQDIIADPNLPDYLVNQSISVSAKLTLKPGVVIAFAQDARIDINSNGSIIAKGEAAKKLNSRAR